MVEEYKSALDVYYRAVNEVVMRYDLDFMRAVAAVAAGLCGVSLNAFFARKNVGGHARQARAFYYYTLRHLTHASYDAISEQSSRIGLTTTLDGVRKAVERMSAVIDTERWWMRRNAEMKRIIELLTDKKQKE